MGIAGQCYCGFIQRFDWGRRADLKLLWLVDIGPRMVIRDPMARRIWAEPIRFLDTLPKMTMSQCEWEQIIPTTNESGENQRKSTIFNMEKRANQK